jgi:hypothetical protein
MAWRRVAVASGLRRSLDSQRGFRGQRALPAAHEPDGAFHGNEGMKHMASAPLPAVYDPGLASARRGAEARDSGAATAVAVLSDGGGRDLSDRFWEGA